jgi:hypothetical protein
MAKYMKNPDGKFQCPECEYGRGDQGKSRQSVSKHFNAKHGEVTVEAPNPPKVEESPKDDVDLIEPHVEEIEIEETEEKPDWLNFDMSGEESDDITVSISPTAASVLRGMRNNPDAPRSEKAMKDFYRQQGRMLKWVFSGGVDPIFEWWAKAVTADENFRINRSAADWELFEDVSTTWLEYNELTLPITPNMVMIGTVGAMYVPVIAAVNRKRNPNKPSLWSRWKTRRALKKALKNKANEVGSWEQN